MAQYRKKASQLLLAIALWQLCSVISLSSSEFSRRGILRDGAILDRHLLAPNSNNNNNPNSAAVDVDGSIVALGTNSDDYNAFLNNGSMVISYYESWMAEDLWLANIPSYSSIVLYSFSIIKDGIPSDPLKYVGKKTIRKLQDRGIKVLISVGGTDNCGDSEEALTPDYMFGESAEGKQDKFAEKMVEIVEKYGLDGVDIDYECSTTFKNGTVGQNADRAFLFTQALRKKMPSKMLTWTAFSDVMRKELYTDHFTTFQKIVPFIDATLWMAYNYGQRRYYDTIEGEFNSLISTFNLKPERVAIGTCVGQGCAYMPELGPTQKDTENYISIAERRGALGLMVWGLVRDYTEADNDWNTTYQYSACSAFDSCGESGEEGPPEPTVTPPPEIVDPPVPEKEYSVFDKAFAIFYSCLILITFVHVLLLTAIFLYGFSSVARNAKGFSRYFSVVIMVLGMSYWSFLYYLVVTAVDWANFFQPEAFETSILSNPMRIYLAWEMVLLIGAVVAQIIIASYAWSAQLTVSEIVELFKQLYGKAYWHVSVLGGGAGKKKHHIGAGGSRRRERGEGGAGAAERSGGAGPWRSGYEGQRAGHSEEADSDDNSHTTEELKGDSGSEDEEFYPVADAAGLSRVPLQVEELRLATVGTVNGEERLEAGQQDQAHGGETPAGGAGDVLVKALPPQTAALSPALLSPPMVEIVMPVYNEPLPTLLAAVESVAGVGWPKDKVRLTMALDDFTISPLFLGLVYHLLHDFGEEEARELRRRKKEVSLDQIPREVLENPVQTIVYRGLQVRVCRFPHGGKRHAQKCAWQLLKEDYESLAQAQEQNERGETEQRQGELSATPLGPQSSEPEPEEQVEGGREKPYVFFIDSDIVLDYYSLCFFVYEFLRRGTTTPMLGCTGIVMCKVKGVWSLSTWMQDCEYIDGQIFNRNFEYYCGNVTCLPGALTMLSYSALKKNETDYFDAKIRPGKVSDFHRFHLGEDRYLTHLLMESASYKYTTGFTMAARCETEGVQGLHSLLKQRRRWLLGGLLNDCFFLTSLHTLKTAPLLTLLTFRRYLGLPILFFYIIILDVIRGKIPIYWWLPVGAVIVLAYVFLIFYSQINLGHRRLWISFLVYVCIRPLFYAIIDFYTIATWNKMTWGGPRTKEGVLGSTTGAKTARSLSQTISVRETPSGGIRKSVESSDVAYISTPSATAGTAIHSAIYAEHGRGEEGLDSSGKGKSKKVAKNGKAEAKKQADEESGLRRLLSDCSISMAREVNEMYADDADGSGYVRADRSLTVDSQASQQLDR